MTDHTALMDSTGALRERADAMWQDLLPLMQAESETGYADKVAALDIIERALTAADASIAELTRERDEAREWRKSIRGLCVALGSDANSWAGDKDGWGFNFEFIKWLHTRANAAEVALAASQAEVERLREGIAREREECAKLCSRDVSFDMWIPGGIVHTETSGPSPLHAAAIRSRTLTVDEPPQELPK